ncbi:hypothetical protein WDU94_005839 [Cyamophila willieti]
MNNTRHDVVKAFRSHVPKIFIPKTILIKMANERIKTDWVTKYRAFAVEHKILWHENWYLTDSEYPIESLEHETSEWAKNKSYPLVWARNSSVYYCKHNQSSIIFKVKHMEHLHDLHNKEHKVEMSEKPCKENEMITTTEEPELTYESLFGSSHEGSSSEESNETDTVLFLLGNVCSWNVTKKVQKVQEGAEDYSKHRNVIVYGIPEEEGEDIMKTVEKIGHDKIGFRKPMDDVERAYRINCTKKIRPLVIKMLKVKYRRKWVQEYRNKFLRNEGHWFLMDDLPKSVQNLHDKTKKWIKKKKYLKVWTLMSEVFYKKNESSPVFKVTDDEHLRYLKRNETKYEVTEYPNFILPEHGDYRKHEIEQNSMQDVSSEENNKLTANLLNRYNITISQM